MPNNSISQIHMNLIIVNNKAILSTNISNPSKNHQPTPHLNRALHLNIIFKQFSTHVNMQHKITIRHFNFKKNLKKLQKKSHI